MRLLLFSSATVIGLAVAAPGLLMRHADWLGGVARSGAATELAAARSTATNDPRQVQIKAERDGHFYVGAEINFRPVRLMVDTGASVVALRQSDAHLVGIRPRPADFERPVQTANGTAYGAEAELDSVAVRDLEVSGVRALILPDDQLSVSLLGGSFLNRLRRFEVSDGTLVFEN